MAVTIGQGIRGLLAGGMVGERVWADRGPKQVGTWPYVTFDDGFDSAPALTGDGAVSMIERFAQVDLWEKFGDEDPDYARWVYDALNGAVLDLGDSKVCRVKVVGAQRIYEPDTNIAHRAFTLSVKHDPSAF